MADMQLRVVAKTRIAKFDKGVDPKKGKPFEVTEKETVLVGEEAQAFLDKLKKGGNPDAIN